MFRLFGPKSNPIPLARTQPMINNTVINELIQVLSNKSTNTNRNKKTQEEYKKLLNRVIRLMDNKPSNTKYQILSIKNRMNELNNRGTSKYITAYINNGSALNSVKFQDLQAFLNTNKYKNYYKQKFVNKNEYENLFNNKHKKTLPNRIKLYDLRLSGNYIEGKLPNGVKPIYGVPEPAIRITNKQRAEIIKRILNSKKNVQK